MAHDHDHSHDHSHDHHHHHHGDDHHHHWDSADYVRGWLARDAGRQGERAPIVARLIAAVPFARDAAIEVLDVGGGAGVIAEAVLEVFPNATVTVQDFSPHMLAAAHRAERSRRPGVDEQRRRAIRSRGLRHRNSQSA